MQVYTWLSARTGLKCLIGSDVKLPGNCRTDRGKQRKGWEKTLLLLDSFFPLFFLSTPQFLTRFVLKAFFRFQ